MDELRSERQAAIDAIHLSGHTPHYIEKEPDLENEKTKEVIDRLIDESDAMVLIYFLTAGAPRPYFQNRTPTLYEFHEFRRKHPKAPVFLFKKEYDELLPSNSLRREFKEYESKKHKGIYFKKFKYPEQLAKYVATQLKKHSSLKGPDKKEKLIVRYQGPDFIGLMERTSGVLATKFRINVDYISFAGRGGVSTFYLSCSRQLLSETSFEKEVPRIKSALEQILRNEFEAAKLDGRVLPGADPKANIVFSVDRDNVTEPKYQLLLDIRTINVPGQLHAVCRVLRDLDFSIDELNLKPAPQEHDRQTILELVISNRDIKRERDLRIAILQLESALKHLVGIRTFSTRVVYNKVNS